jgi:hypothetical protein
VTADGGTGGATPLSGRIEVEDYRAGGSGVGFIDFTAGNNGNKYRTDDVDIQSCSDPNSGDPCFNIGWVRTDEWTAYTVESSGGTVTLTIRVASAYDGRSFHVEMDGVDVTGAVAVPNTGGGQNWVDVTTGPINVSAGLHTLRLVANSGNFNLNYIDVVQ